MAQPLLKGDKSIEYQGIGDQVYCLMMINLFVLDYGNKTEYLSYIFYKMENRAFILII